MRLQPRIDAVGVERMAAFWQLTVAIAAADVVEAYGAERRTLQIVAAHGGGREGEFPEEGQVVGEFSHELELMMIHE